MGNWNANKNQLAKLLVCGTEPQVIGRRSNIANSLWLPARWKATVGNQSVVTWSAKTENNFITQSNRLDYQHFCVPVCKSYFKFQKCCDVIGRRLRNKDYFTSLFNTKNVLIFNSVSIKRAAKKVLKILHCLDFGCQLVKKKTCDSVKPTSLTKLVTIFN